MKNVVNENGDRIGRADVCAGILFWGMMLAWVALALVKGVAA